MWPTNQAHVKRFENLDFLVKIQYFASVLKIFFSYRFVSSFLRNPNILNAQSKSPFNVQLVFILLIILL